MQFIAAIIDWILSAYFYVLLARFILDVVLAVNPQWRPKALLLVAAELVMTLTDPVLKAIRRVIPTIRIGGFGLDFGITIALILTSVLSTLVNLLAFSFS